MSWLVICCEFSVTSVDALPFFFFFSLLNHELNKLDTNDERLTLTPRSRISNSYLYFTRKTLCS